MSSRPIRILHVVGCMDRGGVETWLMQILRNIDRSRFQMDFLVHTAKPGADLARKLRRYINAYSKNAKPIRWKYSDPSRRIRHAKTSSRTVH